MGGNFKMNNGEDSNNLIPYKDYQDYRKRQSRRFSDCACQYEKGSRIGRKSLNYNDRLGYRTEFQRDRDDILYSPSFRQLSYKRQMFSGHGIESFFTRLTHTLIVAQIAKSISLGLQLDEFLTEAIALGHDIGHSPYGHSGERGINRFLIKELFPRLIKRMKIEEIETLTIKERIDKENNYKIEEDGSAQMSLINKTTPDFEILQKLFYCLHSDRDIFDHHKQGYRLMRYLDKGGRGLQLTSNTYYGILRSSGNHTDDDNFSLNIEALDTKYASYEVQVVRIADDIAWTHHDLSQDLQKTGEKPVDALYEYVRENGEESLGVAFDDIREFLQLGRGEICGKFITDIIENNKGRLLPKGYLSKINDGGYSIELSTDMRNILEALKKLVIFTIHEREDIKSISEKSINDIIEICSFLSEGDHFHDLVNETWYNEKDLKSLSDIEQYRYICDYVSFMSDSQAEKFYQENLGSHRSPEISSDWSPLHGD